MCCRYPCQINNNDTLYRNRSLLNCTCNSTVIRPTFVYYTFFMMQCKAKLHVKWHEVEYNNCSKIIVTLEMTIFNM